MEPSSSAPTPPSTLIEPPVVLVATSPGLRGRRARLWAWVLGAGLLAGVISWLGGEWCRELIKPRRHIVNSRGMSLTITDRRGEAVAMARNAGLAFLFLGAALGGGLGAAGGLASGSRGAAMQATGAGLAMGLAAAGGMSLVLLPAYNAYHRLHPDEAASNLLWPLLVHAGIWSAAGAAGGLRSPWAWANATGCRGPCSEDSSARPPAPWPTRLLVPSSPPPGPRSTCPQPGNPDSWPGSPSRSSPQPARRSAWRLRRRHARLRGRRTSSNPRFHMLPIPKHPIVEAGDPVPGGFPRGTQGARPAVSRQSPRGSTIR